MLKLEFLSGARKGEEAILNIASTEEVLRPQIREDDVIKFSAILDQEAKVRLVLHEIQMYATASYRDGEKWIYEWSPGYGEYTHVCFFQNYYGLASLDLLIDPLTPSQVGYRSTTESERPTFTENTILLEYQDIEVLAKAENAERVDSMIEFLAKQNSNLIASIFRVTRLRAGFKNDDGRSDVQYLDRIERNIKELEGLVHYILRTPISKTTLSSRIIIPNQHSVPDDSTISWLNDNTSEIFEIEDSFSSFFEIDGINYQASKIMETFTSTKTDCYENQVIHGYVFILKKSLQNILTTMEGKKLSQPKETPRGYASFFAQINKYSAAINKNKIDRCNTLDRQLMSILAKLRQRLPVPKPLIGIPQLTPKAKHNSAYREVFFRVIEFLKYGKPDWSVNDELLSITSISKLFEYYCLFMLRSKIEQFTAHSVIQEHSSMEFSEQIAKFSYTWRGLTINLLYEPPFWTSGHPKSIGELQVNTEGWTRDQLEKYNSHRKSTNGFRQGVRGKVGINSRRSPDFVIQIEAFEQPTSSLILDAKYTRNEKAFLDYLPDLTMKYIHGIHEQSTGRSQAFGLIIINPTSDKVERTRHFHSHEFTIHGETPVCPALLVSSVDFKTAEKTDSEFHKIIEKSLELMISKFVIEDAPKLSIVA